MESMDREILVDIREVLGAQREEFMEFQATVLKRFDDVEYEQRLLHSQLDMLQTSVYWVLAAIGIFLGGLTLSSIIASTVNAFRPKQTDTPERKDDVHISLSQFAELLLRAQRKE